MAQFYEQFIRETFDEQGRLQTLGYEIPDNFNYAWDVIDALGEQYPDRLAMVWRSDRGERKTLTFGQVRELSRRAAGVFRGLGLEKGDVLMACMRSRWEYWIAALGAHRLGLIFSPVYWRLTEQDLLQRMEQADVRGILCCREDDTAERCFAAAQKADVGIRMTLGSLPGFVDFSAMLESVSPLEERLATRAEEPMLLYFTSGTTGRPKAVLHDHRFALANFCGAHYMQDVHDGSLHFATGDTGWEVVSGTKFYGQWLCLGALLVLDYDRFPPELVLDMLAEEGATSVMAQPTVYRMLLAAGLKGRSLPSVDCWAIGGEKLPPALAEEIINATGRPLFEGYAQSEAGLIASNSKNMGSRKGSAGRILPKYHVELLRDDGTFAAPGEEGEIVILSDGGERPAGLLMGYYKDEESTARMWDGNVFRTGDVAVKDADGYLYYKGRMDGMIKTKGYRVSPAELEDTLSTHSAVAECMAAGIPDDTLGQRICMYVIPVPGILPDENLRRELTEYHNSRCAGFKKIRELWFCTALPRSANGKLLRGPVEDVY